MEESCKAEIEKEKVLEKKWKESHQKEK
jgi:hypothetical protein